MTTFNVNMIKGNHISRTKEATITINGTTVTVHQFGNENTADVWVTTSTTAKRIVKNIDVNEAIEYANQILMTL